MPTANQYSVTWEEYDENVRVEDGESGGKEIVNSINVSSDGVNRIDYIPPIDCVLMVLSEIPNIMTNFRSTTVWAHLPSFS